METYKYIDYLWRLKEIGNEHKDFFAFLKWIMAKLPASGSQRYLKIFIWFSNNLMGNIQGYNRTVRFLVTFVCVVHSARQMSLLNLPNSFSEGNNVKTTLSVVIQILEFHLSQINLECRGSFGSSLGVTVLVQSTIRILLLLGSYDSRYWRLCIV